MVPVLILVIESRPKEGAGGGKLTNVIERYLSRSTASRFRSSTGC